MVKNTFKLLRYGRRTDAVARRGISLVDAVASLAILGMVTVPIATGIAALSKSSFRNYRAAVIRCELVGEAERLRAASFADIALGTTVTSIDLPGVAADRTVTVSLADYDGDASVDAEFKLIVVTLEDRTVGLYRSDWKE